MLSSNRLSDEPTLTRYMSLCGVIRPNELITCVELVIFLLRYLHLVIVNRFYLFPCYQWSQLAGVNNGPDETSQARCLDVIIGKTFNLNVRGSGGAECRLRGLVVRNGKC